ncbi:hypothetical protein PIROE2DRAFT_14840, partial [Piromyces sp. E2]
MRDIAGELTSVCDLPMDDDDDDDGIMIEEGADEPPDYHNDIGNLPHYGEIDQIEQPPIYDQTLRRYVGIEQVQRRIFRNFLTDEEQEQLDRVQDDNEFNRREQIRRNIENKRRNIDNLAQRRRFIPDRPRNRRRPVDQDVRIRQQNRNRRIQHLTANNQARIIQRAWRNRIRKNIENNLNNIEQNINIQKEPDAIKEVEAIRNGELPVDENGYVHFGENDNQSEEEINLNDDPDRPINQEDIEPQMYFGGGYENIPGNGARDGGDSEGENDDPEPQFVVQHHRIFDNDSPIERLRRINIMEYNRRHGAPRFIYARNILDDGLTTIIFDPYAYNKIVLLVLKFVEYHPPAEGENNRSNFRPDFNKRKIFYLHVFENLNDIGFMGWDINIESFQRTSI